MLECFTIAVRFSTYVTLLPCWCVISWIPPSATGQPPPREASLLMSATELMEWPDDRRIIVLDVRNADAYAVQHVPGARHVDVASWKQYFDTDGRLDNESFWAETLGALGIDGEQTIVVYGTPVTEAARVWWLLKYVGCADVRLLDGGFESYVAQQGPTSVVPPVVVPTRFQPRFRRERIITADELFADGVQGGRCQVVDNRSREEYIGDDQRGARSGHIPGALHNDWRDFMAADGTFLPVHELRAILLAAGIDLNQNWATHCHSGGRSSVGAFVLEYVTGRPARNYYGSWADWSRRDDLPVNR